MFKKQKINKIEKNVFVIYLIKASTVIAPIPRTHPVFAKACGKVKAPAPTIKLNI